MLRRQLLILAVVVFGLAGLARESSAQAEQKTPEALLQEMAGAYAAAQSYSDNDEAIFRNVDGSERLRVTYRIWLARPEHFRIDADAKPAGGGESRREVMWSDGVVVRTWATDKPVSTQAKVKLVGSRMFGTYAYHVPTLFEASYGANRRLHELKTPVLVGEEPFEGVDCYRIKGDWEGDTYEVWLAKPDLLVRKIVANYSGYTLEEIHREIAVNQPIDEAVFRFAPENEALPLPKKK